MRYLLLIFLGSVELSPEISLNFEGSFVLIDAELLQKFIVVLINQAFQNFEFHHVVIILGIFGLDITDLGHWQI